MHRVAVIDVGNTSTSIAAAIEGRIVGLRHRRGGWPAADDAAAELRRLQKRHGVTDAVLGSVVPARNAAWRQAARAVFGCAPLVVSHRLDLGVGIEYPRPASIGADRLADASGAVARYGAPVIVADFGTALTFDVVTADAVYRGGIIAPGLPLMLDYLAERTALLPRIRLAGAVGRWGRSTAGAMRVGARVGYRGMVREITAHLLAAWRGRRPALIATGGYAAWALAGSGLNYIIDSDVTLFGLARIHALNRGPAWTRKSGGKQ